MKHFLSIIILLFFGTQLSHAQDSLLNNFAHEYKATFQYKDGKFEGTTLDSLIHKISKHKYILLGEDHHINEVLEFTNYLNQKIDFDNYIAEGDQQITNTLHTYFRKSRKEYNTFLKENSGHFGFYTFEKDRNLMENYFRKNKKVIELDQVFFNSDLPLLKYLFEISKNKDAKIIYKQLFNKSEERWKNYKQKLPTTPPFNENDIPIMFSTEISNELKKVLQFNISNIERNTIEQLIKSNEIYRLSIIGKGLESHSDRISLMKNNLLNNLPSLQGKRNLFKFGANHVTKHKSLWQNSSDVGNMVLNIADAENEKSLHIAILPKSGFSGSFFNEKQKISELDILKPFYKIENIDSEWLLFDLSKIRNQIRTQKIIIESVSLSNFIEGYDYLILIPEVTAQKK